MISGATRGTGGHALGAHLADAKHLNEEAVLGSSRGLVGGTIREQIAEITDLTSHSRAAQPLYHVHADPPEGAAWSEQTWSRYWLLFEREFGLERAAYSEEHHLKEGRAHRHRVYSLVREDGTTNPMRQDFARREKLSRIIEHETGAPMVSGAFNRKVHQFLLQDGRYDIAQAMEHGGLLDGSRTRAVLTPRERAQAERTGIDPQDIATQALAAWRASDDGKSFRAALLEHGLRIMQGERVPVLVDQAGGTHPLARLLGKASKAAGEVRINAAAVDARLAGQQLDPLPEGGRGRRRVFQPQVGAAVAPACGSKSSLPGSIAPMLTALQDIAVPSTGRIEDIRLGVVVDLGAGATMPDADGMDSVRPMDPSKPGDADRFWREMAAAWTRRLEKQAADLARIQQQHTTAHAHGGHHDPGTGITDDTTGQLGRAGAGADPALVAGPHRRDPRRHQGSEAAAHSGQERHDRGFLRGNGGRQDGRPADAPASAAGSAGGGGGPDSPAPADPVRPGRGAAAPGSQAGRGHRAADRCRLEQARLRSGLRRTGAEGTLRDLTARLRAGPTEADVGYRVRVLRQHGILAGLPGHMAIVRRRDPDETSMEAGERRTRWMAAAQDSYDTSWLPEAVVADLDNVHVDERHQAVIVVLRSETRIVDRLDRVDIVGTAGDVSAGELAEAVLRRGWDQVDVHGPAALHRAIATSLKFPSDPAPGSTRSYAP